MRFLKLEMVNFKPYHENQEIVLFNKQRKERAITLNIGPTGHGKTSISEAIEWCLFGESCKPAGLHWEKWVNDLSTETAKDRKERHVKMSVMLTVEIENEHYRIIRSGKINVDTGKKEKDSEVSILKGGKPIKEDPNTFINERFLPVHLMEYFIFDADDMLRLFEENQEVTIKDHINKILRLEVLDDIVEALKRVNELYEDEIGQIQSEIPGDISKQIRVQKKELQRKKRAIGKVQKEIKKLEREKQELFPRSPTGSLKRFSVLVDERDRLDQNIERMNKQFKEEKFQEDTLLPSTIHLLFLEDIIADELKKLREKKPTRNEFETSVNMIRPIIEKKKYSGILFGKRENVSLIMDARKIDKSNLDDIDNLEFATGERGIRIDQIRIFGTYRDQIRPLSVLFFKFKDKINEALSKLVKVRNKIRQIGETERNKELKKKFDKFNELERIIKEKKDLVKEIREKMAEIEEEVENLGEKLELKKEQKRRIESLQSRKADVTTMHGIAERTKSEFMKNLLSAVNKSASEFLLRTVKDQRRFHSIEVYPDYRLDIKKENGQVLGKERINRGNLQVALMAFFFGLSKHLGKDIPYIIDAPLIRLDPGHDKRLLTQLGEGEKQIIMHVIPGKEYTPESFRWLRPYVNTQNWIYRKEYKTTGVNISYAESIDPHSVIEYDIDKF